MLKILFGDVMAWWWTRTGRQRAGVKLLIAIAAALYLSVGLSIGWVYANVAFLCLAVLVGLPALIAVAIDYISSGE